MRSRHLLGIAALSVATIIPAAIIPAAALVTSAAGRPQDIDIAVECLDSGAQKFTFTAHNNEGTTIELNNDNVTYTGFDPPPDPTQFSPTTVPDGGTSTFQVVRLPSSPVVGDVSIQVGFSVVGGEGGALFGSATIDGCGTAPTTTTTAPPTTQPPAVRPVTAEPSFTG